jgi:hypothetical protein
VWNEVGLRTVINSRIQFANTAIRVICICRDENDNVAGTTAAVVAWILWNNRNSWVRNGVKESAKVLAMCALHMMGEWCALNVLQQQNITSGTVLTATQWQQLRDG